MLAVVDNNVWISAVLSPDGHCRPVLTAFRLGLFIAVVSPEMQRELSQTLTSARFRARYPLSRTEAGRIVMLINRRARLVPDPEPPTICRDARDNMFLGVAVASGAAYIVTRDDDLKAAPEVRAYLTPHGCLVLSVRTFLERLSRA